jgi:CDP-diacylglycerol--serine O-phosphatidyltransferase
VIRKKQGRISGERRRRLKRGIYLLPNLFTTGAMFAGFFAMIAAMDGRFTAAAVAVFVAMALDGLDGRVARLTGTESEFGREFDSLSDMVSFGMAPAMVVYHWGLGVLGEAPWWWWAHVSWLVAFFFAVAVALRLARFNTRTETTDRRFFQGLPSPSAAACVVGGVWFLHSLGLHFPATVLPVYALTLGVAVLMVSSISYYSFKDLDLAGGKVPFTYAILIPLAFILIALSPSKVLFLLFFAYALSGPALALWRRRRRRVAHPAGDDGD